MLRERCVFGLLARLLVRRLNRRDARLPNIVCIIPRKDLLPSGAWAIQRGSS